MEQYWMFKNVMKIKTQPFFPS